MENSFTLTPCLSGTIIWQQPALQPYLVQLKQLISAPPDIYQALYMETLLHFAEFCQAMPFDVHEPKPYSLLQRQMELALTALKLRRGKMLPQHSESEIIAEQEPIWTYAIFTACLLTGLSRLHQDRQVELFLNQQEKIGEWSALTGNLFEPQTHYKIKSSHNLPLVRPAICNALLVGRIIPTVALRWLTNQPAIFTSWWQAITHESDSPRDGLSTLIEEAAVKINYPLINESNTESSTALNQENQSSLNNQALADLTTWVQQYYETKGCDAERDLLLHIPAGLFIEVKRMADFLNLYSKYGSQKDLLKYLDEYLLKENNSPWHRFRLARFEKRLILEGIILPEGFLPPAIKLLPLQSSFVPDIPL